MESCHVVDMWGVMIQCRVREVYRFNIGRAQAVVNCISWVTSGTCIDSTTNQAANASFRILWPAIWCYVIWTKDSTLRHTQANKWVMSTNLKKNYVLSTLHFFTGEELFFIGRTLLICLSLSWTKNSTFPYNVIGE